jgi:hypothetical protein
MFLEAHGVVQQKLIRQGMPVASDEAAATAHGQQQQAYTQVPNDF